MTDFAIPEHYFTICVGINRCPHSHRAPLLPTAEDDARQVDATFARMGIPAGQRLLLLGKDATLAKLHNAFAHFFCEYPSRKDAIFFYYAGYLIAKPAHRSATSASAYADVLLATHDYIKHREQPQIALPGLKSLREEYAAESRARHIFCMIDGYALPYNLQLPDETAHITQHLRQFMNNTSPGRIAISSYADLDVALNAQKQKRRFSLYLRQALEGKAPPLVYGQDRILTTRSLYAYIAQQLTPLQYLPILSYTISDNILIARYTAREQQPTETLAQTDQLPRLLPAARPQPRTQPISNPIPDSNTVTPPSFFMPRDTPPSTDKPPFIRKTDKNSTPNSANEDSVTGKNNNNPMANAKASTARSTKLSIAVCSSKQDLVYAQEFREHLSSMKQQSRAIGYWDTGMVSSEQQRDAQLIQFVWGAHIVLLLLSPDFFTEFNQGLIQPLFAAASQGKIVVIPIKTRPCLLELSYLKNIPLLNEIALQSYRHPRERQQVWLKALHIVHAELHKSGI